LFYRCCAFSTRHEAEAQQAKKPHAHDDAVQLKGAKVTEDGGEGLPLTDGDDQKFEVEIKDKYEGEEKEPLKSEVSGSGEGAPAGETAGQADTVATVRFKTYEPSLWLAIMRTYCKPFIVGAFFKLGHDVLLFVSPLLLKYVSFVSWCDVIVVHLNITIVVLFCMNAC